MGLQPVRDLVGAEPRWRQEAQRLVRAGRLAAQGEARSAALCDREAGDTRCGVPERQLKEASVVATAASTAGFGDQHGGVRQPPRRGWAASTAGFGGQVARWPGLAALGWEIG